MITYNGEHYKTREITICPNDMAMTVTIAERRLWNAIRDKVEDGCRYEAGIDAKIMYYCDEAQWGMNDEQLARFLEEL
jgi:hypothetical protein